MLAKLSLSGEGAKAKGPAPTLDEAETLLPAKGPAPTLDEAETLLPAKGPGHSSPEELKASSVNAMVR